MRQHTRAGLQRIVQIAALLLAAISATGCSPCWVTRYWNPVWSPDGMQLAYITETYEEPGYTSDESVTVLNLSWGQAKDIYAHSYIDSISWTPDSRIIVVDETMWTMKPDGSDLRAITSPDHKPFTISTSEMSPDQTSLIVSGWTDADGLFMDLLDSTGQTRQQFGEGLDPKWSPDGKRIVFSNFTEEVGKVVGPVEIFVMNADGSGIVQLTHGSINSSDPAWSPDGKQIAFTSFREGKHDIYTISVDGGKETAVTALGQAGGNIAWSPDGSRIAFIAWHSGLVEIYAINPDGTRLTQITHNPTINFACTHPPIVPIN